MTSVNQYLHLPQQLSLYSPLAVNSHQDVEVKKGPAVWTCQRQRFSTLTPSQLSYNVNLSDPSKNLISRYMYNEIQATVTINATPATPGQTVQNYLQNNIALRQYPLGSVTNTCQIFLNENNIATQVSQWLHPLAWSQDYLHNDAIDESLTPVMPDMAQNYGDMSNSLLNPLNGYFPGSVPFIYPRGAHNADFFTTQNGTGGTGGGAWIFNMTLREPILHPLLAYNWNKQGRALAYVNNFSITLNWLANLSRMFSVNGVNCPGVTINVALNDSNLCMFWFMIPSIQILPELVSYSYNTLISNQTQGMLPIAPGVSTTLVSQGLTWNQIPKRIYIWVGNQSTDTSTGFYLADSWFSIQQVVITFNTKTSLLANLQSADLYTACQVGAGSRISYIQSQYYVGSVLEVDPTVLLQLEADVTSGCLGSFNFQVNVQCKNINPTLTITPNLWVLQSNDSVCQISNAYISSFIQGYLKSSDVISANQSPAVPAPFSSSNMYGGGAMMGQIGGGVWDDIKNFLGKAFQFAKDNKVLSRGLSFVPGPVGLIGSQVANAFGLGGDSYGNGLVNVAPGQYGYGGRHITADQMLAQQYRQRYGRGY